MKKTLAIISCIVIFLTTITIGFVVYKPLDQPQIDILESVVYDAYTSDNFLIEVPEGVNVSKSETSISASMDGYHGYVEGKIVNNEFETVPIVNIFSYIAIILIGGLLVLGVCILVFNAVALCLYFALVITSDADENLSINLKGVKNIKQFFWKIKNWISVKRTIAILVVIAIIVAIFFLFMYILRPFNETEWQQCETYATSIYESAGNLTEIPDNFNINVKSSEITISHDLRFSSLKADIINGELVFTRNYENIPRVIISITIATMLPMCTIMLFCVGYLLYDEFLEYRIYNLKEKIKVKRSKRKVEKIKKSVKRKRLK